jgi:NTE family protein
VPVTPLIREPVDYLLAVSLDGPAEVPTNPLMADTAGGYRQRIGKFIGRLVPHGEAKPHEPGAFDLLNQSMDLMQANLSRLRLAAYEPDLLIRMPRNVSTAYEFYRARELIELGRERTRQVLSEWKERVRVPQT